MAGASLLALLDDIASVLDDVATMTQVAARKTAGVLGDDLALNAQQVAGVRAERELPVVWAVAWGSLRNKAILVPAALAISAFLPWLVMPLLMLGGLYLCYEGVEKLAERWLDHADPADGGKQPDIQPEDLPAFEAEKVQGAIRTDFVLSAEIIVIALGTVADQPWLTQISVLVGIALLMTVGVYGLVAGIVKLDDLGFWLLRRGRGGQGLGRLLVAAAPRLMKWLAVVGTVAMFLVGGGILVHGLPWLHHLLDALSPAIGAWHGVMGLVLDAVTGVVGGALAQGIVHAVNALRGRFSH